MQIPFNKPYMSGKETTYITEAVQSGKISGNGVFTQKCQSFFENKYGFKKCLLTTSCTDALEMAAILLDIKQGDEVIIPSFTFVSTANAFALRGAKIIFADSSFDNPNIDVDKIEKLINKKTKAIVPVHYAGMAVDMDKIMLLSQKYGLMIVEDAAQAIDTYYINSDGIRKSLGSIGHLSAFSFHETKNIISGEGGMLVVNDERFIKRAEIIWEKGTNRSAFFRGEIDKYGWVDIGSSFLPSEIIAAFLWAQLENLEKIQLKRIKVWNKYDENFRNILDLKHDVMLPAISNSSTNNAHMYYLVCKNEKERNELIHYLKDNGIYAVFHYLSLHKSNYYREKYHGDNLKESDRFSSSLLRLPFFYELKESDQQYIIDKILKFFKE